jgi:hypothetical protein
MRMPASAFRVPSKEVLTDRSFMAWPPLHFHDRTIELEVASELAPDAPAYARGFIGVSFRISSGYGWIVGDVRFGEARRARDRPLGVGFGHDRSREPETVTASGHVSRLGRRGWLLPRA